MIAAILLYLLVGLVLTAQYFFRFYVVNGHMYTSKSDMLKEGWVFYFQIGVLWVFGLDYLLGGITDYRAIVESPKEK